MTAKSLASVFVSLPHGEQAGQLARFAHALTIDARDTYIPATEAIADPVRLRGFNEIQHRLSAQIQNILEGGAGRYPDEVFFGVLLDAISDLRANLLRKEMEKFSARNFRNARSHRRAG